MVKTYLVVRNGNDSGVIKDYNDNFEYTVGSNTYDMQYSTTKVINMKDLFKNKKSFNEDIGSWIHLMLLI